MSKFKKLFAIISICLIAICTSVAIISVKAESEYDDWEFFSGVNQSIMQRHAHPRKLLNVPTYRQAESYTSGVACVESVLRYAKYDFDIRENNLARALGASEEKGTSSQKMAGYLNAVRYNNTEEQQFQATVKTEMTLDSLKSELDQGHPVICDIQAWDWDENEEYTMDLDYSNEWYCDHWVVAIGYNKDNIFFMDPSTGANYTYIPNDKLISRWHAYEIDENDQNIKTFQMGIVVEYKGGEPDCEKYKDAFYGLM
ncbi:MAG: C39 family peptidase [Eubacterium sp.]|nr:C39 family peptidase [Eubacterium sp.]